MFNENQLRDIIRKVINEEEYVEFEPYEKNGYEVRTPFRFDNGELAMAYKSNDVERGPLFIDKNFRESTGSLSLNSKELKSSTDFYDRYRAAFLNTKYSNRNQLAAVFRFRRGKKNLALARRMDDNVVLIDKRGDLSTDGITEKSYDIKGNVKLAYENTQKLIKGGQLGKNQYRPVYGDEDVNFGSFSNF